jgi:hypothetical protein
VCSEWAQNLEAHIFNKNNSCGNFIQRINGRENVQLRDCHFRWSTVRGLRYLRVQDLNVTLQDAVLVHTPLSLSGLADIFEETFPLFQLNSVVVVVVVSALSLRYYRVVA